MRMRIRIIQQPSNAIIDGVRVNCYYVGHVYEVSNTLGELFLAEGWAVPAAPETRAQPPPLPVPIYSKQ